MRFLFLFSFLILTQFANAQIYRGGIYKTADDYKNSKLTDYGLYKYAEIGSGSTVTFMEGEKLVIYKLKDLECFGFRDHNGIEYVYQASDEVKQIVIGGPIMLLTEGTAIVKKDALGNILSINSDVLFYSDGPGGKLKPIKKLLAQDKAILNAYLQDNASLKEKALTFVMLYNQRHGWVK